MKKETDVKQNKIATIRWKYDDASGQAAEINKKTIVKPRALTKDKYKEYKKSNISAKKQSIKSGSRIGISCGYIGRRSQKSIFQRKSGKR